MARAANNGPALEVLHKVQSRLIDIVPTGNCRSHGDCIEMKVRADEEARGGGGVKHDGINCERQVPQPVVISSKPRASEGAHSDVLLQVLAEERMDARVTQRSKGASAPT
eukprot:6179840-Pleurochrysis_carterae.AAC.2